MIHVGPSGKATRNTESRGSGGLLKLNHFVTTQQLHKVLAYLEEEKEDAIRGINRSEEIKICHLPLAQGLSQIVTKSTTGCSISRTVVSFPCITVMHGDLPPRSIDSPPENIVNVSPDALDVLRSTL